MGVLLEVTGVRADLTEQAAVEGDIALSLARSSFPALSPRKFIVATGESDCGISRKHRRVTLCYGKAWFKRVRHAHDE